MKKGRDNMIDFIIIEDNLTDLSKYKIIIDKVMMNYDIDYEITIYDKYSTKIKKLLKNNKFKIYIISNSDQKRNQEMIYYIREEQNDWQSLIILITEEETSNLNNKGLFLLDILSKQRDFKETLKRDLQICLKNYDQRPNTLKFCYKKTFYNIEYWKILYVEKQTDKKISKIKTIEKDYDIQGSLNQLEKKLDKRFLKCNRSYIINLEQIESYNPKENKMIFKNQETFDAISRNKKKEIINYLRRIEK